MFARTRQTAIATFCVAACLGGLVSMVSVEAFSLEHHATAHHLNDAA
ncbi:hypothetical protein KSF73_08260 [Burkholderiaceae bacterium DAT-1]|nr:hypothetical protein [Burkholderiaceae bacterium DAT-1]